MIGSSVAKGRRARDEAEKPFWISYSDMMTALMVLFLVVMSVALLAATKTLTDAEKAEAARASDIAQCLDELAAEASSFNGVSVKKANMTVDFGERARFAKDKATLSYEDRDHLRRFVPVVLNMANKDCGKRWLKQVVVEGFTDDTGTYLHNLDLSLRRSQSVLCALLEDVGVLTPDQRLDITRLFFVGGFSSNSLKTTKEESRRIELKLVFKNLPSSAEANVDAGSQAPISLDNLGSCALR